MGIFAQQPDTPTTTPNITVKFTNSTINVTIWRTVTLIPRPAVPYPRPAAPTPRHEVLTTSTPRGGAPDAGPGSHSTSSESSKEIQQADSSESSSGEIQPAAPTRPFPVTPRPVLRAPVTGSIVVVGPWVNQALPGANIEANNAAAGIHLPRKGSQLPSSQGVGASSSASGVGVAVAVVAAIVVGSVIFVIKKYRYNSPALVEA